LEEKKRLEEEAKLADESDSDDELEANLNLAKEALSHLPWEMQNMNLKKNKHDLMFQVDSKKDESKGGQIFKQAKKQFPMFPYQEKKVKWDDYGEPIDHNDYQVVNEIKSRFTINNDDESSDDNDNSSGESDYNSDSEQNQKPAKKTQNIEDQVNYVEEDIDILLKKPPMKYTFKPDEPIDIRSTIMYIDFDGRADTDSCVKIIQQVRPRKLLLIGSELNRIDNFITAVRNTHDSSIKSQMELYTPTENGQNLNATQETHIYQVRLKDQLVSSLHFQQTRGVEVTWLDGLTNFSTKSAALLAQERDKDKLNTNKNLMPTLDQTLPQGVDGHAPVFINDVRLSDFKQVLINEDFRAEFVGGILIVNGCVGLKRSQQGRVEIEGTLNNDYYKVRDLLYSQYALI